MSNPAVKPIPDGMHSVTPHLVCANAAEAIAFYVKAFNAVEAARTAWPGWQDLACDGAHRRFAGDAGR